MKAKYLICVFLNVILLISISSSAHSLTYNAYHIQALPIMTEDAKVILQQGNTGTSIIYVNNTSAKVNISTQTTTYDYVLKVVNQVSNDWMIRLRAYDQLNISRLSNCTFYFHDGSISDQIRILNGEYNQEYGVWYNLTALNTVYIAANVSASSSGMSHVYSYLETLVPNTSIYNLMIVAFEIS